MERRSGPTLARSLDPRGLSGYAALFGAEARLGVVTETVAPGAFGRALAGGRDIVALVDHDPTRLLARQRSGTLRLREDTQGLAFDLDLPDTQAGRDILALAARGDLGGMSFGFTIPEGGERWDGNHRTLLQVDLVEISVVSAWPAYDSTVVKPRARRRNHYRRRLAQITLDSLEL
ncbi:MAG: HK97 family phage prohead protease [Pseudomonadota bacterium]